MSFHIYGSLSDASGGSNSPAFPAVMFANTNTLAVTGAGSGYLAIWNQQSNVPFLGTLNSDGLLNAARATGRQSFLCASTGVQRKPDRDCRRQRVLGHDD
jgi:hypothetical protein